MHTGDEVLDAFMQQLVNRDELVPASTPDLVFQQDNYMDSAEVSQDVLQSLKPRFGNDPRYYLLLLQFAPLGDQPTEFQSSFAGVNVSAHYKYLEEARQRGCADGAILLRLLRGYEGQWQSDARQASGGSPPDSRKASPSELLAYHMGIRRLQDAKYGKPEHTLLAELFAAAPDEALPHYYAMQFAAERGDYEGALAELRTGNHAPRNTAMVGCPFDTMYEAALQGQPVGDKLMGGWLATAQWRDPLPNFIRTKSAIKDLVYLAVERRDLAAWMSCISSPAGLATWKEAR